MSTVNIYSKISCKNTEIFNSVIVTCFYQAVQASAIARKLVSMLYKKICCQAFDTSNGKQSQQINL